MTDGAVNALKVAYLFNARNEELLENSDIVLRKCYML
jgi:hypothetical protein